METNLSKEKFIGEILQDHRLGNLKKYTQKWARPEQACMLSHFSYVQLIVTLWTAAHQALLSMGFSRQEYWSGLPCSPLGDLPNPGIEPASPMSPALAGGFFTTSATWEALTAGGVRLIYSFTPHVQAFRWGLQQCQYFPQDYMLTFHQ